MVGSLTSVIVLTTFLGQQVKTDNPACQDEIVAANLCDEAYRLWDLTHQMDTELDIYKLENSALKKKLQIVTATAAVHVKTVYVEQRTSTFEDILAVSAAVALFIGGFLIGGAIN